MEGQAASSNSRLRREQDARRLQSALLIADQVQFDLIQQTFERSFRHCASWAILPRLRFMHTLHYTTQIRSQVAPVDLERILWGSLRHLELWDNLLLQQTSKI